MRGLCTHVILQYMIFFLYIFSHDEFVLSCHGILILMFYWLPVIFIMPAFHPFIEVFGWSWLLWVALMEFCKLLWASYKVPCRVLSWVRIITFPTCMILE